MSCTERELIVFALSKNKVIRNFTRQEIPVSDGLVFRTDYFPFGGVQKVGISCLHAKRRIQRLDQRVEVGFKEERDPGQGRSQLLLHCMKRNLCSRNTERYALQ